MGSIYKYTNQINGKAYIGKTYRDAETRRKEHLSGRGNQPLADAFKKYGEANFTYEILHDGIIPEMLDAFEIQAIAEHNTVAPNGYNLTHGGEGGSHCEETRRKMSEAKKGKNSGEKNPFYGKTHTPESRAKMSDSSKGHTTWMKGKTHTPESRAKISESKKGHTPWNKGKKVSNPHWLGRKHTDESRHKMSESCKGRIPWNKGKKGLQTAWNKGKKGSTPNWLGRKHTDESRRKMSEATKGQTAWNKGKKGVYTDETLRRMSEARETPECIAAREFFFSLPSDMDLAEKRKHLRQKFPNKSSSQIYKWGKKFDSEA